MKNIFTPSEIEIIMLQRKDIISTSGDIPGSPDIEDEDFPKVTVGPGGDIGLPFDPFSVD